MRVLIPVAGNSPFFPPSDFPFPKPLIEVGGKLMIARVVENLLRIDDDMEFVFVAMQEEANRFSYENIFSLITGGRAKTVALRSRTAGALCSCLMAIDHIDNDEPLVIVNSDQIFDDDLGVLLKSLIDQDADAGVLTFDATHPRWSYVRLENGNEVVEASEKRVISRDAVAGFYYFKKGADFVRAAQSSIVANDSVDGTYYVAPSLNHLILEGLKVRSVKVAREAYHTFFLPANIVAFERLNAPADDLETHRKPVNIVVPAAGEGSRFAREGWGAPKPFIDVLGKPMICHVLENVALPGARFIVLARSEQVDSYSAANAALAFHDATVVPVRALTEGTACTVLLAREHIDNDCPLLIANSDQLVDFDCAAFVKDSDDRDLDGSILVFRDIARDPKWSFAAVDAQGLVTKTVEKVAISDLATVGIYYFRRGDEFVSAAIDMIASNDRSNNEFYTCPIYNYMISSGKRIGVYEVASDSMSGLGTPADLTAYIEKLGGPPSKHMPATKVVA